MVLGFAQIERINEAKMQFILGVFLFVIVVGLVDLRVPWPKARNPSARS